MSAQDIRNTIAILEQVGMEYVANRDFRLVSKVEKDGITYALGASDDSDDDARKVSYDIYKFERKDGYEFKGTQYSQDVYSRVQPLDLSPYVRPNEAHKAFKSWLEQQ